MRKGIDCRGVEWEERELSVQMSNLTSTRFGLLTALFPVNIEGNSLYANWLCKCDCGNYVVRNAASLKNGKTCSCGCMRYADMRTSKMNKHQQNVGKKFGKLTVLDVVDSPDHVKDNRFYYKCLCDCGNTTVVRATDLKSGKVTSCNCAKSDYQAANREKLVGRTFGRLTVMYCTGVKNNVSYLHCKCECGNEVDVNIGDLCNGHTSSCGCVLSVGELNIIKILDKANINYMHNKGYFKDLVSDKGLTLRYDFIIFNNNNPIRLIEFDGPQHNKVSDLFGVEAFQKLQYHDNLKNKYALSHNIPLVRIPYSKRNTITLEDLLGDKYLIKGEI